MSVASRYEKREILGEGGMGVVYRAWDTEVRREVAFKTMRGDTQYRAALELFRKECAVLATLNHPNIVDIYDIGEDEYSRQPYFVMPLLRGFTLDKLIRGASQRLTVERIVTIIGHTCRGLQAAHDGGLIHRDLKPSNIFVMDDDSVKIIDFGVVHLMDQNSSMGVKGTLFYMPPEQIRMERPTPMSDIFSLGVVCYEALTRRRPFTGETRDEVIRAILEHTPPPAHDLNPMTPPALSQVVHAAMAKAPYHRFSTPRELAGDLLKAMRNEPIARFDPSRIEPRLRKAKEALAEDEYEFANDILAELEAEGYLHPEIRPLRKEVAQATRQKLTGQLLESARRRFASEEYEQSLHKIQDILQMEPHHAGALALKDEIENQRSSTQIEQWFRIAREHIDNRAFEPARQALQNVLQLRPTDSGAIRLLSEVGRIEQDYIRKRQEKEKHYQAALDHWRNGEVTAALSKLEKVLDLDQQAPDAGAPEQAAEYRSLYQKVRSERLAIQAAYEEARKHLADGNFTKANELCDIYLAKYPGHALFQALKFDIGERQRQTISAYLAKVDRQADSEPDLDRKMKILEDALALYPDETHFEKARKMVGSKRDLVNSIVHKARNLEQRGLFGDALGQWDILKTIYPQYPGLDFEYERVQKRRDEQMRVDARARWVDQIDRALNAGEYSKAIALLESALGEFPNDSELTPLDRLARQGLARVAEAQTLLDEGQALRAQNRTAEALAALKRAFELDEHNAVTRALLLDALVKQASELAGADLDAAEQLIEQALALDPSSAPAKSIRSMLADCKREDTVRRQVARARELQAEGKIREALAEVDRGLAVYPHEARLLQLRGTLRRGGSEARPGEAPSSEEPQPGLNPELAAAQNRAAGHSSDQQFQATSEELTLKWPAPQEGKGAATAAGTLRSTEFFKPARTPGPPANGGEGKPAPALKPPRKASRLTAAGRKIPGWFPVVLLPLVALFAWALLHSKKPPPPPPAPKANVRVTFTPTPRDAKLSIDGGAESATLTPMLAEGRHSYKLTREGYGPHSGELSVKAGMAPQAPALTPLTQVLRLSAERGQATLGGQKMADSTLLPPGETRLIWTDGERAISALVNGRPGDWPEIKTVRMSGYAQAVIAAAFGGRVRLYAPHFVRLPDQAATVVPAGGYLEVPANFDVSEDGKNYHSVALPLDSHPAVHVIVAEPDSGVLEIRSSTEGAAVRIDKAFRGEIQNGRWRRNAAFGSHTVALSKDGFTGQERPVVIAKGKPPVNLQMDLVSALSNLVIHGAPVGARVLVDKLAKGEIKADGSFNAPVPPGVSDILIQKDDYEPWSKSGVRFEAGKSVPLEAVLERLAHALVRLSPETATAECRGLGPLHTGIELKAPKGSYVCSAQAPNFEPLSGKTFTLKPGENAPVEFTLKPIPPKPVAIEQPPAPPQPQPVRRLSGFKETVEGWSHHRNGEMKLESRGVISFKIPIRSIVYNSSFLNKWKKTSWIITLAPKGQISADDNDLGAGSEAQDYQEITIDLQPDQIIMKGGAPGGLRMGVHGQTPVSIKFKGDVLLRDFRFKTK